MIVGVPAYGGQKRNVGAVFGPEIARVRRRAGISADDLRAALADVGIKWSAASLSRFENGQRDLSAGEFLMLSDGLSAAFGWSAKLADFVPADVEWIEITPVLAVHVSDLPGRVAA